jgi:hypothetical protein
MEFDIYFDICKEDIAKNWLIIAACSQSSGFDNWFQYKFLKYGGKPDHQDLSNLISSLNEVLKEGAM